MEEGVAAVDYMADIWVGNWKEEIQWEIQLGLNREAMGKAEISELIQILTSRQKLPESKGAEEKTDQGSSHQVHRS